MPARPREFDVIVLGAGAAGLMCAAVAAQRGRKVVLLEHNGQPGRKILISGGGRCNFTNLHCTPASFLSENEHFAKSALARYQPQHFIELVERYGIAWHEKTLGQLFCDQSARAILDMLLAECELGGVEIGLNAKGIEVAGTAGGFGVSCSHGRVQRWSPGCGDRGSVDSEDGRDGVGVRTGAAIRTGGGGAASGAGAAGAGRRGSRLDRTCGCCRGRRSAGGRGNEVQREDAGDASRTERSGGVAGLVVLAAGRGAGGGFCAGTGGRGGSSG